jgi:hypothetical protein
LFIFYFTTRQPHCQRLAMLRTTKTTASDSDFCQQRKGMGSAPNKKDLPKISKPNAILP